MVGIISPFQVVAIPHSPLRSGPTIVETPSSLSRQITRVLISPLLSSNYDASLNYMFQTENMFDQKANGSLAAGYDMMSVSCSYFFASWMILTSSIRLLVQR